MAPSDHTKMTDEELLLEFCQELEARAQIDERKCMEQTGFHSGFSTVTNKRIKAIRKLLKTHEQS